MTEKELFDYLKKTTIENIELMEYGYGKGDCQGWEEAPGGRIDVGLDLK